MQSLYLLGDRVVDDHGLAADLGAIVRLGQLSCHIQAEVAVPLDLLVPKLNSFATRTLHMMHSYIAEVMSPCLYKP